MEHEEQFKKILAETFGTDAESLKDEYTPDDVGNWSPITHMEIVAKFDQEFGVNLNVEEITEMDSIGRMKEVLKRHGVKL